MTRICETTGLDYFGARYFSGAHRRFTGPDSEAASASLFNPQTWNAYTYAYNNPQKYVDPNGEVGVLATAAIGAGIGAVGGAIFDVSNQLILNGGDISAINGREVAGAAVGGLVSGGLAGLTLGLIPAPAVLTSSYLATAAVVNGGANVAGGLVQREVDPAAPGSAAVDFLSGAAGGGLGTKIAYVRYPLPNVRKELARITNSNRRSLRPERIAAFNQYADRADDPEHCREFRHWQFHHEFRHELVLGRSSVFHETEAEGYVRPHFGRARQRSL